MGKKNNEKGTIEETDRCLLQRTRSTTRQNYEDQEALGDWLHYTETVSQDIRLFTKQHLANYFRGRNKMINKEEHEATGQFLMSLTAQDAIDALNRGKEEMHTASKFTPLKQTEGYQEYISTCELMQKYARDGGRVKIPQLQFYFTFSKWANEHL
jgi:hypothetical protein